jgi:hypothetical protein
LDANGMNPEILGAEILTKAGVGDEKNHRNWMELMGIDEQKISKVGN